MQKHARFRIWFLSVTGSLFFVSFVGALVYPDLVFVVRFAGGVVRLWRATATESVGNSITRASREKLEVRLLTDMLVGGFQVLLRPLLSPSILLFARL